MSNIKDKINNDKKMDNSGEREKKIFFVLEEINKENKNKKNNINIGFYIKIENKYFLNKTNNKYKYFLSIFLSDFTFIGYCSQYFLRTILKKCQLYYVKPDDNGETLYAKFNLHTIDYFDEELEFARNQISTFQL